ncbi:DUF4129 domain-containing transglutaminase family protein [Sporosarcina jiandibaonis]|uniref:DUF4129 domain-containing transglutaminase family protein n=1 Tax=Sporosarcina jiandibaonis TaxID=2715535 RepID=UPI0015529C61|nr:transglutaminase domain-containing protein [Sporosarcina jiandibaonis]
MSEMRLDKWFLAILYLLAIVLLREWLLPVMELTQTGQISLFLIFIVIAFFLALQSVKWWISSLIKVLYIIWAIHYTFFEGILLTKETSTLLLEDFNSNFAVILVGNWSELSNPFRTMLFFILLWMTTYLIRHWIESRKSIFLFYSMTIIFIAIIDTFTAYSAKGSILIIMITGLLLLGLLTIPKLAEKHSLSISANKLVSISFPLVVILVISGVFMLTLPKLEPAWADPVPFLTSVVDGAGEGGNGEGISKTGYDPDDSRLGGPFIQDNTLIFEASVPKKQYWKIETKNTYTSKGWEQPSESSVITYSSNMGMGTFAESEGIISGESKIAQLNILQRFPFIVYPYGMMNVETDEDVQFMKLEMLEQYRTTIGDEPVSLDSYGIEYIEHDFSLKALRETTMDEVISLEDDFADYLQLPKELPERVGELAETITRSSESVYDKAKAIERYFGRNGFVYDQKNVAIPAEDQDYVDQFLFDSKSGYCDNFSTSMVVMLRTIGIPAKWVKGFAPGELGRNENKESVYKITNNEAHSWVEAFMPGIGWMPFEPTIGFGGASSIEYDIELQLDDPEVPEMPEPERKKLEQKSKPKKEDKKSAFDFNKNFDFLKQWIMDKKWILLAILSISTFLVAILYRSRRKWLPKLLVRYYRFGKNDWTKYAKQYVSLLKQLDRFGFKRKNGETLLKYAIQVDAYFGGDTMQNLTTAYEKGIYGENRTEHDWQRLQELWEHLINRTSD